MTVAEIIEQFTDDGFTLIIYDLASETELYRGYASDVYTEDVAELEVMSIDPPEKAWEITLNVEVNNNDYYSGDDSYFDDEF